MMDSPTFLVKINTIPLPHSPAIARFRVSLDVFYRPATPAAYASSRIKPATESIGYRGIPEFPLPNA
jgi:hypothetical protein